MNALSAPLSIHRPKCLHATRTEAGPGGIQLAGVFLSTTPTSDLSNDRPMRITGIALAVALACCGGEVGRPDMGNEHQGQQEQLSQHDRELLALRLCQAQAVPGNDVAWMWLGYSEAWWCMQDLIATCDLTDIEQCQLAASPAASTEPLAACIVNRCGTQLPAPR